MVVFCDCWCYWFFNSHEQDEIKAKDQWVSVNVSIRLIGVRNWYQQLLEGLELSAHTLTPLLLSGNFIWNNVHFFLVTIYLHGSPSTGRSWTVAKCNENRYENQSQNNLSCRTVVRVEYDRLQKRSCFTKWKGKYSSLLGAKLMLSRTHFGLLLPHGTSRRKSSLWLTRFWPAGSLHPSFLASWLPWGAAMWLKVT